MPSEGDMQATVIVLAYHGASYLEQCLASLLPRPAHVQILLADNGSTDASVAIARRFAPDVQVVELGANYGFSGGMNRGMRLALGLERRAGLELRPADAVLLLNQDTRCLPGWHEEMLAPLADPSVGAVGCKIYGPDERTIQHVGGRLGLPRALCSHVGAGERDQGQYEQLVDVEYATGAALALRAAALAEVGLLDERYNPAYMEEVDLCVRLRGAGYRVVVNPAARIVHHEGGSPARRFMRLVWHTRGRLLFLIKHAPLGELLGAFYAAEHAALEQSAGHEDMRVLKRGYLEAIMRFPDWCAARAELRGAPVEPAERELLLDMLCRLRDRCSAVDAAALQRMARA